MEIVKRILFFLFLWYLEVVLELESLLAVGAFEFAQASALVVADHVTLQTVHVGKVLLAHGARLANKKRTPRRRKEKKRGVIKMATETKTPPTTADVDDTRVV